MRLLPLKWQDGNRRGIGKARMFASCQADPEQSAKAWDSRGRLDQNVNSTALPALYRVGALHRMTSQNGGDDGSRIEGPQRIGDKVMPGVGDIFRWSEPRPDRLDVRITLTERTKSKKLERSTATACYHFCYPTLEDRAGQDRTVSDGQGLASKPKNRPYRYRQ